MPQNTTRAGLPYPVGTDRVMDGDDAIKALAQRLDGSDAAGVPSVPFSLAAGQASVPISAGTQGSVGVTFPAGRFTQVPRVTQSFVAAPATVSMIRTSGTVATTGFSVVVNAAATVTTTYTVDWVAVQMTSAAGSG